MRARPEVLVSVIDRVSEMTGNQPTAESEDDADDEKYLLSHIRRCGFDSSSARNLDLARCVARSVQR